MPVNPITLSKAVAYDVKNKYPKFNPKGDSDAIIAVGYDEYNPYYITNGQVKDLIIPAMINSEQNNQKKFEANEMKNSTYNETSSLKAMILSKISSFSTTANKQQLNPQI